MTWNGPAGDQCFHDPIGLGPRGSEPTRLDPGGPDSIGCDATGPDLPGNPIGYNPQRHAATGHAAAVPVFRWIPALIVTLLIAACGLNPPSASLDGGDVVEIPSVEASLARMPPGPIPAVFMRPAGQGRFPAVIVLHGCGGRGASQVYWARRLNRWGYAALIPDSMTPRGVKRVCEPDAQPLVTPRDRVSDIASAVAWLRTQPGIDPGRIAVLGLSHGGDAAVIATERIYKNLGLRAAVDYYGPCVDPDAHGTVPVLVLVGGADDWGHPGLRCEAFGQDLTPGQPFEIFVYPGVYHAFDNPDMVRTTSNGHILEYNAAAAADSYVRVHTFLDRWVKH